MDKHILFEGISGEDCFELQEQMMKYRKWLASFKLLYSDENEEILDIPVTKLISREELLSIPQKSISFIEITAAAGMGTPGEVFFITDKLKSYKFNFNNGDITEADLFKKYPLLESRHNV